MANTKIVEVLLPGGEVVLAEVAVPGGDVGALDRLKLDQARITAARVAHWARESVMATLPDKPNRFGVEIGLKLVVRSGVLTSVLAAASTEASIAIKMEWDRD